MSDGRGLGTLVGAVAGFFTGGIGWVSAGAALGGAIGGLLEPKKRTETNRIDDIKVSISKYGGGIPETWGNNIPEATWIWSTYVIELPEEPTGGKGGGVENTNYRQFIHGTLCLGRTPPAGTTIAIRKLWIDGKLNFDASTNLSAAQALATETNPWQQLVLLPGFGDQLPWPIMEAWEGVGNVPAFRGRITAPIFGLECPGGRIPQIQIELNLNYDDVPLTPTLGAFDEIVSGTNVSALAAPDGAIWNIGSASTVPGSNTVIVSYAFNGSTVVKGQRDFTASEMSNLPVVVNGADKPTGLYMHRSVGQEIYLLDLESMNVGLLYQTDGFLPGTSSNDYGRLRAAYDPTIQAFAFIASSNSLDHIPPLIFGNPGVIQCVDTTGAVGPIAFGSEVLYLMKSEGGFLSITKRDGLDGSVLGSDIIGPSSLNIDVGRSALYLSTDGLFGTTWDSVNRFRIYKIGDASWDLLVDVDGAAMGAVNPGSTRAFYASNNMATAGPFGDSSFNLIRYHSVQPADANVADFIESQSLRAGLTGDQIDVSSIDDSFWGITLKTPSNARSNIAPLMTYSGLGVVEEDGLLRYFNRADKTSVATIAYEELAHTEDGSEPGDPSPLVRANAQELPLSVTVTYSDPNFDYQQSTVKAMRYAVDSVSDESTVLDMAMTGARAATIAQRILLERWVSQMTRSLSVSRKYAYLSAGDVITVLSKVGGYGDFMISKITDTGAVIQIECFPADAELLMQTVPGPGGYRSQEIEALAPPQELQLIDGPILQDSDNNAGLYAAMEPYVGAATGAALWVGPDDQSLQSRGVVSNAAVLGHLESVLGDWSSDLMDEKNTVIVNIGDGELHSTTRDLIDTTTVNAAAVGANGRWEYLQFLRATDLGGGRYLLSGLIRGARGTERNRGNHGGHDRFVLLAKPGMLRPSMDVGEIGSTKSYRAVSTGRSLDSAISQRYANTAEGLKPFSPWDARKSSAASNDQTLTWQRRTRMSSNSLRGVVPLGEASESYSVDFYTSSDFTTLAGTLPSTSRSLTITSAQQTAFGLTPGAALNVRIYQISEAVGRGAPLEATV